MKTDDLIELLGTNLEPVKGEPLRNALLVAVAVGAIAALCLMMAMFRAAGIAAGGESLGLKVVALAFTLALVAAGAGALVRAARPGEPGRRASMLIGLLFLVILAAGVVALLWAGPAAWSGMLFGSPWAACLVCIPLFAAAPFAALVWALRKGAPTHLARTGALAGPGAIGATVFAVHNSAGSILFIALWYGGPIVLCALAGAILGPRLLRW